MPGRAEIDDWCLLGEDSRQPRVPNPVPVNSVNSIELLLRRRGEDPASWPADPTLALAALLVVYSTRCRIRVFPASLELRVGRGSVPATLRFRTVWRLRLLRSRSSIGAGSLTDTLGPVARTLLSGLQRVRSGMWVRILMLR